MEGYVDKFKGLSLGEKIILIAAPLFFIDGFLPWFDYDVAGFGGPSRSGWSGDFSFLSIIAILAAVVMAAQIAVARFTTLQLPALRSGAACGEGRRPELSIDLPSVIDRPSPRSGARRCESVLPSAFQGQQRLRHNLAVGFPPGNRSRRFGVE